MVWALGLAGAIAVGLPVGAWLLSRNLGPPKQVLGGPVPGDRTDRWLYDHFHLGVLDRSRVRQAAFAGRALDEPELRRAACGLAADILRRRGRTWPLLAVGVFNVVLGVGILAVGIASLATGQGVALGIVLTAEAIWFIGFGGWRATAGARLQRKIVENAAKTLELNGGDIHGQARRQR